MRRVFVPDGRSEDDALAGASLLGIGAHPDDLELMAWHGIFSAHGEKRFAGVIVTDGGDLAAARWEEQKKAAQIGGYAAVVGFGLPSETIKHGRNESLILALDDVLDRVRPEVVYTHNLLDAHDTHVSVVQHVIEALRRMPPLVRPRAVYGCEVWRSLDWLAPVDKVSFDVSGREQLAAELMGVFQTQIGGGKRYDLATVGRKRANATYAQAYVPDAASAVELAMDLTPLVVDSSLDVHTFAMATVKRFADDALARLQRGW